MVGVAGGTRRRVVGVAGAGCAVVSLALQAVTAAMGESAAVPGLGPATVLPPWDAAAGPDSVTVTVLLAVAVLFGIVAVALGLVAVASGARPSPRLVAVAGLAAVAVLVVVPPLGSADHLSYVAYGRIALAGDDPYTEAPGTWRDGRDPVAGAVQPPWREEPSVYGPVATAAQAAVAAVGDGSLRRTVWGLQLLVGVCFLLTAFALDRIARTTGPGTPGADEGGADEGGAEEGRTGGGRAGQGDGGPDPSGTARARVAVLWTVNPLLLGQLVLGAHLDAVAVAVATVAVALLRRSPLAAGVLVGVAAGVKAPYALVGLAICWALRGLPRREALAVAGRGLAGAALVLVPAHLWSGWHTYDQAGRARRFVSFATPWRLLVDRLDPVFGADAVRSAIGPAAVLVMVGIAVLLSRRLARVTFAGSARDPVPAAAARAWLVLALAWVLAAPYALPWYDAILWAPLVLAAGTGTAGWVLLDAAVLTRLGVLALAYLPGRVVSLAPEVEAVTLGFRREVAPWLVLAAALTVLGWARQRSRGARPQPRGSRPRPQGSPPSPAR
ncbi:MAG: hypothetical protein GXX79_19740 [Actinomycetales bacterium]|nr:hypothetical protein [Actinomycetales bacterium]